MDRTILKKMKNAIVLISDENNVEFVKQVIYSSYKYGNWREDYVLLSHEIPERKLKWFRDKKIHIIKYEPIINKKMQGWPPSVFGKYYLLHPMMKKWKKLIYLDTDIIVRKDINSLKNIERFGACTEPYYKKLKWQLKKPEKINKKYNINVKSFNVGVMVIDTKINSLKLFNKAHVLTKKNKHYIEYPEQAIFNMIFYKKWEKIPFIYNDTYPTQKYKHTDYLTIRKTDEYSAILHFFDKFKPWEKNNPYFKEWKRNYEKSDELFEIKQEIKKPKEKEKYIIEILCKIEHIFVMLSRIRKSLENTDRIIGKIGLTVKKYNPWLYNKLKKIKP